MSTVTQLMNPGHADCKIFALSTAALTSQVWKEQVGTSPLPFGCAMCLWPLWRQKQWPPLHADLMTCHCQTQMLWSWKHCCSVCLTLSLGLLFPPSPVTHPPALRTGSASAEGSSGSLRPPSPGAPRPTPPPPHHWPQWGSRDASCPLHSFPECLGPARKLTILFVWGAFCYVMSNSCN